MPLGLRPPAADYNITAIALTQYFLVLANSCRAPAFQPACVVGNCICVCPGWRPLFAPTNAPGGGTGAGDQAGYRAVLLLREAHMRGRRLVGPGAHHQGAASVRRRQVGFPLRWHAVLALLATELCWHTCRYNSMYTFSLYVNASKAFCTAHES